MLERVTVIIPAHNRPERLQRLLDYYAGSGIRIIIPDSSTEPFAGTIDPSTTLYIHRPGLHFLFKINEILPLIETPYVLYCADDDFAVPDAIAEIAAFLDANADYTVAQGHYLTFIPSSNSIEFSPRYIRNFDCRITANTALERLHDKSQGLYAPLLYGVARTEAFRTIYSYCFRPDGSLRFTNLFLAELFFENAMLILGKYATLPCFFSARELIPGSATTFTVPASVIRTSPEYSTEYQGYISALADLLADNSSLSRDEAIAAIISIDNTPTEKSSISFKRKVNTFIDRYPLLSPLAALSRWRYRQKGLQAVKGMPSYPCTFSTPARDAIERLVMRR